MMTTTGCPSCSFSTDLLTNIIMALKCLRISNSHQIECKLSVRLSHCLHTFENQSRKACGGVVYENDGVVAFWKLLTPVNVAQVAEWADPKLHRDDTKSILSLVE